MKAKNVSIFGDSISTYEGYNPPGYAVFYDKEMQKRNGLQSADDTWWSIVLKSIGGTLCVNASYSGRRVSGDSFPAACSDESVFHLRKDDKCIPDMVLVYLGYNDFGYGVKLCRNRLSNPFIKDTRFFLDAYNDMLVKIKKEYPKTAVICGTLLRTSIRNRDDFIFPQEVGGLSFDEYNRAIRKACKRNRVYLADITLTDYLCETIDGSHPTKNGQATLARAWIEKLPDEDFG